MTALRSVLSLQMNRLVAGVPSELGSLSRLSYGLHLQTNSLSLTIPTEIGHMVALQTFFNLHANSLSGAIREFRTGSGRKSILTFDLHTSPPTFPTQRLNSAA